MDVATTIPDLSLTRVTIDVGSAATFRENINTNFSVYKSQLETEVNSYVKVAVGELQTRMGDWNTTTYGTITNFLTNSWQASWPKVLATLIGTDYPYSTYGSFTSLLGTGWNKTPYGTISARLSGARTGRRVLVSYNSNPTTSDVANTRSEAKAYDLICEIYTV